MDYNRFAVAETLEFVQWMASLADLRLRLRIARRVEDLRRGHVGRLVAVGRGVFELPIAGAEHLVLYVRRDGPLLAVLMGGETARRHADLAHALALAYWTDTRTLHERPPA